VLRVPRKCVPRKCHSFDTARTQTCAQLAGSLEPREAGGPLPHPRVGYGVGPTASSLSGYARVRGPVRPFHHRPWLAAVAVVVGGLACALALFWTLLLPLLAIALIPLTVVRAGRVASEPASA
jgi:hypothetical protein